MADRGMGEGGKVSGFEFKVPSSAEGIPSEKVQSSAEGIPSEKVQSLKKVASFGCMGQRAKSREPR